MSIGNTPPPIPTESDSGDKKREQEVEKKLSEKPPIPPRNSPPPVPPRPNNSSSEQENSNPTASVKIGPATRPKPKKPGSPMAQEDVIPIIPRRQDNDLSEKTLGKRTITASNIPLNTDTTTRYRKQLATPEDTRNCKELCLFHLSKIINLQIQTNVFENLPQEDSREIKELASFLKHKLSEIGNNKWSIDQIPDEEKIISETGTQIDFICEAFKKQTTPEQPKSPLKQVLKEAEKKLAGSKNNQDEIYISTNELLDKYSLQELQAVTPPKKFIAMVNSKLVKKEIIKNTIAETQGLFREVGVKSQIEKFSTAMNKNTLLSKLKNARGINILDDTHTVAGYVKMAFREHYKLTGNTKNSFLNKFNSLPTLQEKLRFIDLNDAIYFTCNHINTQKPKNNVTMDMASLNKALGPSIFPPIIPDINTKLSVEEVSAVMNSVTNNQNNNLDGFLKAWPQAKAEMKLT